MSETKFEKDIFERDKRGIIRKEDPKWNLRELGGRG
jgi:hypothetical protein